MSSENSENSGVDLSYLKSLIGDNPDDLQDFINMFLEQAPEELELLGTHIADGNFEEIAKCSHKMKSTVHNMGMEACAGLLKDIQIEAHSNKNIQVIQAQYAMVSRQCQNAFKELGEGAGN